MNKSAVLRCVVLFVPLAACAFGQTEAAPSSSPSADQATRRVQVPAAIASTLVLQRTPVKYPDEARAAHIQGTVVLKIVTSYSGDVEEMAVVSGDPTLAQAAMETVKTWKYKPYLLDGSPAQMETQIVIGFHLKTDPQPKEAPLGLFHDNAYSNDYFGIYYPLSRDWVLDTHVMRNQLLAQGNSKSGSVLLAAIHIPQDDDYLRADTSFTVLAMGGDRTYKPEDCKSELESVANELHSRKEGQQKGDLTQFGIAGHDFYRADFEFRVGVDHRTWLCSPVGDYLLQWNIVGWSKQAIEAAVSTLNSITPTPPPLAKPETPAESPKAAERVHVAQGVTAGLLVKKVNPVYPEEARRARIQGVVRLSAVITRNGDIADLEILDGPLELAVSAVNAVRKWKYRPYLLMGSPVEVQSEIMVNYLLSGR
jgi:TonB family protein